jgi:hypothetical protein
MHMVSETFIFKKSKSLIFDVAARPNFIFAKFFPEHKKGKKKDE